MLGLTFKENCPDIRNTKVIDIIKELKEYTPNILVHDPHADKEEARHEYGIELASFDDLSQLTALVVAVAHEQFKLMSIEHYKTRLNGIKLVVDIKDMLNKTEADKCGITVVKNITRK